MNLNNEIDDLVNNVKKIVLASSNPHKQEEMNSIASGYNVEFLLVGDGFDPDETGDTFQQNAYIKAFEAAKLTGMPALADDSGLCVEFLEGAPGIYSARYAETPLKRIEKLLKALEGVDVDERAARFVCEMALVAPDGKLLHASKGVLEGSIALDVRGENGFGYDPIFYLDDKGMTLAEVDEDEKNNISHRARALVPMLDWICKNL